MAQGESVRVDTCSRDDGAVMTLPEARDLVRELALAATEGGADAWVAGARLLEQLDGRSWLLLDEAARAFTYAGGTPVSGAQGWLGTSAAEPTGFVAAVTSLHVDGRIRQRATRMLAETDSRIAITAVAVRLLDHVPQVRDEAKRALLSTSAVGSAETVLGVLLAGRNRQYAAAALESVRETLLHAQPAAELLLTLLPSRQRDVRRWAFSFGHERHLLTSEQLLAAVRSDPDQWLRATCSGWLLDAATPQQLRTLLTARTVEARLVALARVPDEALDDDDLVRLLADRAPRVREQARWRARRRGIDAADWYRRQLNVPTTPARILAACLDGLAAVGGTQDLPAFTARLRHCRVRVRVAAVTGVSTYAAREEALATLEPVLLDSSPRVSSTAARALVRLQAPQATAEVAWTSAQPWSRRAAWRLSRGAGNWDRVEADLRAGGDDDPQLASLGLAGVRNWLETSAATTYAVLSDAQRERIRELLATGPLGEARLRTVSFHARIQLPRSRAPHGDGYAYFAAAERQSQGQSTGQVMVVSRCKPLLNMA